MNPWLGDRRGFLSDWTTQQWVRATGRRVDLATASWLRGPCATPTGVAESDFERYAAGARLEMRPSAGGAEGLLDDLAALRSESPDAVGAGESAGADLSVAEAVALALPDADETVREAVARW